MRRALISNLKTRLKGNVNTIILYSTASGTAEKYAKRLHEILSGLKLGVTMFNLVEWDAVESEFSRSKERKLMLLVTSTYGNGAVPKSGELFESYLKQKSDKTLELIEYSIFGVGDKRYEIFCGAVNVYDSLLQKKDAKPIAGTIVRSSVGHYEDDFISWLEKIAPTVIEYTKADKGKFMDKLEEYRITKSAYTIFIGEDRNIKDIDEFRSPNDSTFCAGIKSITNEGVYEKDKEVWCIKLSLPQGDLGMWFPGDNINIYPKNMLTPRLEAFCKDLGIQSLYSTLVIKTLKGNILP